MSFFRSLFKPRSGASPLSTTSALPAVVQAAMLTAGIVPGKEPARNSSITARMERDKAEYEAILQNEYGGDEKAMSAALRAQTAARRGEAPVASPARPAAASIYSGIKSKFWDKKLAEIRARREATPSASAPTLAPAPAGNHRIVGAPPAPSPASPPEASHRIVTPPPQTAVKPDHTERLLARIEELETKLAAMPAQVAAAVANPPRKLSAMEMIGKGMAAGRSPSITDPNWKPEVQKLSTQSQLGLVHAEIRRETDPVKKAALGKRREALQAAIAEELRAAARH